MRSNLLGECLGQILLEKKLISGDALAASVARMQKEKRQQGQILIEMGALSPYNLQRALVDQVEAKLLEMFSWPDGKFMLSAGERTRNATNAPRAPAGGADPGRDPASLRRGPAEDGAGPLRRSLRRAQRRPDVAAARDDGRSDRAGLHPRAARPQRLAAARGDPRARQDPDHEGSPAAGGALRSGDDPATRGDRTASAPRPRPHPPPPPHPRPSASRRRLAAGSCR